MNRWSYSSLSTYKQCPAKYAYAYVSKLPRASSKAADRGTALHEEAEMCLLNPMSPIPDSLSKIGAKIELYRTKRGIPEDTWLLDRNWNPVENSDSAWIKSVIDLHYIDEGVLYIRDYKSGREYPTHRDQLELYSIMGLRKYQEVDRVETSAVYIDAGNEGAEGGIIRGMLPFYIKKWTKDAEEMEADREFAPNPGAACKFCPYKDDSGGPCSAHRNR